MLILNLQFKKGKNTFSQKKTNKIDCRRGELYLKHMYSHAYIFLPKTKCKHLHSGPLQHSLPNVCLLQNIKSLSMIFHKQLEVGYTNFKISESIYLFKQLNCWCRRKIRCYRLKQRKRNYYIKTFLRKLGVTQQQSWKLASSGKGWWRMSLNNVMYRGMNLNWFKRNSYFSFNEAFGKHKFETVLCNIARTVV